MKISYLLAIVALITLLGASFALGATGQNATITAGTTGNYTGVGAAAAGSVAAQAGNVTEVDVETNMSTTKWQGFYGNVSGSLVLSQNSNIFYDFGGGSSITATAVYASQNSTFDWSSIQLTTAAEIDTAFGFSTPSDVDQAADIFTDASIGPYDGVTTTGTTLVGGNFDTYAVDDGTVSDVSNFAFGAEVVNAGAVGFLGGTNTYHYHMLVPMDALSATYYFYMSI